MLLSIESFSFLHSTMEEPLDLVGFKCFKLFLKIRKSDLEYISHFCVCVSRLDGKYRIMGSSLRVLLFGIRCAFVMLLNQMSISS